MHLKPASGFVTVLIKKCFHLEKMRQKIRKLKADNCIEKNRQRLSVVEFQDFYDSLSFLGQKIEVGQIFFSL